MVIIAPDSFKGSLPAAEVANELAAGLSAGQASPLITLAPQSDGGEGLLDAVASARSGQWHSTRLTGIHGHEMDAPWFLLADGTAVLESATVLGLPLVDKKDAPSLQHRGSCALGQLLLAVMDHGVRNVIIGLGGSACNDAGIGVLAALGAQAHDHTGRAVAPTMNGLLSLQRLSLAGLDPRLAGLSIRVLCDVNNPLLGADGASRIYGPQKGLTPDEITAVESAFKNLAVLAGGASKAEVPGSGAAGGLGFALSLIGGHLEPGAAAVFRLTELIPKMRRASWVITGEGRSDLQTLAGKLPLAIAQAARPVPAVLVSGDVADNARPALSREFRQIHTLVRRAGSTEAALAEPRRWLHEIGRDLREALIES